MNIIKTQKDICKKYNADFLEVSDDMILGISLNVKENKFPIHGLRHPVNVHSCGWYIWSGDYSTDPNFFKPIHVKHIPNWQPIIIKYLGLGPGWRFLITPDYEDVWHDLDLLKI